jgi:UDP-N-acetylmuramate dehydrogenase
MNAGTFGEYMDGILDSVTVLMKDNEVVTLDPDQCEFGYRTSRFLKTGEIILRCEISGELVDPDLLAPEIRTRLLRRGDTQPIDCPSCGCVFRNPPGEQSAARLIQEAGLKGERRGGAVISDKHANFIVNDRNAKAVDILELMALARNRVRERFAVMLLPEVQAYGFPTTLEGMLNAIHDS